MMAFIFSFMVSPGLTFVQIEGLNGRRKETIAGVVSGRHTILLVSGGRECGMSLGTRVGASRYFVECLVGKIAWNRSRVRSAIDTSGWLLRAYPREARYSKVLSVLKYFVPRATKLSIR
jgi:hypothetical protein